MEAYETLMGLLNQALLVMTPFDKAKDGLRLEDRVQNKGQQDGAARQRTCNPEADEVNSEHSHPLGLVRLFPSPR